MYRIIAYHGKGKNKVASDLHLLWDNFRIFAASRRLKHVYYFQAVDDKKGVNLILVIQYDSEAKSRECFRGLAPESKQNVDYWFYVRE